MSLGLLLDAARYLEQQEKDKVKGNDNGVVFSGISPHKGDFYGHSRNHYSSSDPYYGSFHHVGHTAGLLPSPPLPHTAPASPSNEYCHGDVSSPSIGGTVLKLAGRASLPPRVCVSYPCSPVSSPPPIHQALTPRSSPLEGYRPDLTMSSPCSEKSCSTYLSCESLQSHNYDGSLLNGVVKSFGRSDDAGSYDGKKRPSSSTPSREVHNKLEKNRRAHLKECFEILRHQLPAMENKKISNQTILKAAQRHIQYLKRKERESEHEMEQLARLKISHQQQLSTLKKELQARWDHLDFATLLPESPPDGDVDATDEGPGLTNGGPEYDQNGQPNQYGHGKVGVNGASNYNGQQGQHRPPSQRGQTQHLSRLLLPTNGLAVSISPRSSPSNPFRRQSSPGSHCPQLVDPNLPLNLSTDASTQVKFQSSPECDGEVEHSTNRGNRHFTNGMDVSSFKQQFSPNMIVKQESVVIKQETFDPFPAPTVNVQLPAQLLSTGSNTVSMGNTVNMGMSNIQWQGIPTLQVITPEGLNILPSTISDNKQPFTITLTPSGPRATELTNNTTNQPLVVGLDKNGVPAWHFAVPTDAKGMAGPVIQGSNSGRMMAAVPLNLSVGGHPTTVQVSTPTSVVSSYLPLTHANGVTHLVSGISLSGAPIMVTSQPRPALASLMARTMAQTGGVSSSGAGTMQYHYAGSLGGLVKPLVMMSAPPPSGGLVVGSRPAGAEEEVAMLGGSL